MCECERRLVRLVCKPSGEDRGYMTEFMGEASQALILMSGCGGRVEVWSLAPEPRALVGSEAWSPSVMVQLKFCRN